jgi:hypothetical protein
MRPFPFGVLSLLPFLPWLAAQGDVHDIAPRVVTIPRVAVATNVLARPGFVPPPPPAGRPKARRTLAPGAGGNPLPASPPTTLGPPPAATVDDPATFRVWANTLAEVPGLSSSYYQWPPEPVTVVNRDIAILTANNYAVGSVDNGQTWGLWDPNNFPTRDGGFNGDQRVACAHSVGMTLWVLQYALDPITSRTGAHRIAVSPTHGDLRNGNFTSFIDITPQQFGIAANTWFDFPDITVGNNFVYGSANVYDSSTPANYVDTVLWRASIAELQTAPQINFSFYRRAQLGSDTPRLCQDTTDVLWGAMPFASTHIRMLWWPESGALSVENKTVATVGAGNSNGAGPDGRDWLGFDNHRILGAARGSGEIVFLRSSGPLPPARPHDFVRVVRFATATRALIAEEDIWAPDFAISYPAVASNAAGEYGVTFATGGGTEYPRTSAIIVDGFEPGFSGHMAVWLSNGTHGPTNNRWGDYFSVQRHPTANRSWTASAMALNGGSTRSFADNRFVWFGREANEPPWSTLNVTSTPAAGALVAIAQTDRFGNRDGTTPFTRSYGPWQGVRLTAPAVFVSGTNAYQFDRWVRDGVWQAAGQQVLDIWAGLPLGPTNVEARYTPAPALVVRSLPMTGVQIQASPADLTGRTGGTSDFTLAYQANTLVTLQAPASLVDPTTQRTWVFHSWNVNGTAGYPNPVTIDVGGGATATAIYTGLVALRISSQPAAGAAVSVAPTDYNGLGNGITPFDRTYVYATGVTLTAPPTHQGLSFSHWLFNGIPWTSGQRTGSIYMTGDSQAVAVYGTAVLNGVYWGEVTPAVSPAPTATAVMAFDGARGRAVLFHGNGQTWEFDGTLWAQVAPASSPPARTGMAIAYDGSRHRCVLFGGGSFDDTWLWDGANWTPSNPAVRPPARSGHGLAYDAARDRVVLYGGAGSSGGLDDTWLFDGTNWAQATPTSSPGARRWFGIAHDALRQRTVVNGGLLASGVGARDTWEWNGADWQRAATSSGLNRRMHALAYDPVRGRVVAFGGMTSVAGQTVYLDATEEWDGATWTVRDPANRPGARRGHTMAFDSRRGRVLLFGGTDGTTTSGETWAYQALCDTVGQAHATGNLACTCTSALVAGGILCVTYPSPTGLAFTMIAIAPGTRPPLQFDPPTLCTTGFVFAIPAASTELSLGSPATSCIALPANPAYVGLGLVVQGAVVDAGNCMRLTDAVAAIVQAP